MSGLGVDTGGIDTSITTLTTARTGIEADLAKLETTSAQLASQWSGEARLAYAAAHAAWHRHLTAMNAILAKAITALEASRDEYIATEQRVAERWSIG
jgi:WXG100 family type VII secretion target